MDTTQQNMSLLLLSDIHMNKKNVQAVVEWYARERPPISYILLLGDFHNIDNWSEAPDEKHLEDVRELLAPIDGLGIPCFLIPGNHDPPSMFVDGARLGTHIENIHNRVVSLREDLQILAFGGSVPGYIKGEMCWQGYPFKSEEDIRRSFEGISTQFEKDTKQTILMTHCGPTLSTTTLSYNPEGVEIVSGSSTLSDFLRTHSKSVVMNVHGHTHDGFGYRWVNNINVVNAGPLVFGRFTTVELLRRSAGWSIGNVKLISV